MLIGDRIKELRTEAKMTQPELADKIGLTRSTVAAYENNTRQPSFQILVRLAHTFRVSTDYLLLGNNDNDTLDVSGLSGEQKAILESLIKNFQDTNEFIRRDTKDRNYLVMRNKELKEKLEKKEDIE